MSKPTVLLAALATLLPAAAHAQGNRQYDGPGVGGGYYAPVSPPPGDDPGRRPPQPLDQQLHDAQLRHDQGVAQLRRQFSRHEITRSQMNAGTRQLGATMDAEIARARQEAARR